MQRRQLKPAAVFILTFALVASALTARAETRVTGRTRADIEKAITTALADDGCVYFPGGEYPIDDTLHVKAIGLRLRAAAAWNPGLGAYNPPYAVRLKWTGATGGTMLRLIGHGCQFERITFDLNGRDSQLKPTKAGAGVGVLLANEVGYGCSKNEFTGCYFYNAAYNASGESEPLAVALQAGEKITDHNCDLLRVTRCTFYACGTGFASINHQSVDHVFSACDWFACNVAADFRAGGKTRIVNSSFIHTDLILKVGFGGRNSGFYTIRDSIVEPWGMANRYTSIVDARQTDDVARILIDGLAEGGRDQAADSYADKDATAYRIGSKVTLETRNVTRFANGWPLKTGAGAWIAVEDQFEADPVANLVLPGGRGRLIQDSGPDTKLIRPAQAGGAIRFWSTSGAGIAPRESN